MCSVSLAGEKGKSMDEVWFTNKDCTALEAKLFKSLEKHREGSKKSTKITDGKYIAGLITRIETLNPNGPEMIKMGGDAKYMTLSFICGDGVRDLEIFEDRIKTPGTGFNDVKTPTEIKIVAEMNGLVSPSLKSVLPKIEGHEYAFADFTFAFKGITNWDAAPATLSGSTEHFILKVKGKPDQELKVQSGQVPPQPLPFTVGKKKFTLYTYQTKEGVSLHPADFQIR